MPPLSKRFRVCGLGFRVWKGVGSLHRDNGKRSWKLLCGIYCGYIGILQKNGNCYVGFGFRVSALGLKAHLEWSGFWVRILIGTSQKRKRMEGYPGSSLGLSSAFGRFGFNSYGISLYELQSKFLL